MNHINVTKADGKITIQSLTPQPVQVRVLLGTGAFVPSSHGRSVGQGNQG